MILVRALPLSHTCLPYQSTLSRSTNLLFGRLTHDDKSAVIVEGLINIARKLAIRIIAEGVETERQAAQLLAFGCKLGQGYLFSKAVHRDEATAMLLRLAQKQSDIAGALVA